MASPRNSLATELFACGVDYKRGTSAFALVFGTLSLLLVIIFGITLSNFIEYKHYDKQEEATLIFGIVLYGTHVLSCASVVLAVRIGCRFLLIPWMIVACVMLALAFRSLWSIIGMSFLGFSGSSEYNAKNSLVFQACFNILVILLFFGFGRCVSKLYIILRAESAMRKLHRQNQSCQPDGTVRQTVDQCYEVHQPPPYTENFQPHDPGNCYPVENYNMTGMVDEPPPRYDTAVRAGEKSGFDSPPPRYSDVT